MSIIKWVLVVLGVLILLIGGVFGYFYYTFNKSGPMASLIIDSGTVQYKVDGGEWKNADNGMTLKQGYSVKTSENSEATIILSNSIARLDSNTEVNVDSLSKEKTTLVMTAGRIWNNLLKLSGISSYDLKTPNAIASVRGTVFSCEYNPSTQTTICKQVEGTTTITLNSGETQELLAGKQLTAGTDGKAQVFDVDLSDEYIVRNLAKDEQYKKQLKECIEKTYQTAINLAISRGYVTREDLETGFESWIAGEFTIKEMINSGEIPSEIALLIKNPEDRGNFPCVLA